MNYDYVTSFVPAISSLVKTTIKVPRRAHDQVRSGQSEGSRTEVTRSMCSSVKLHHHDSGMARFHFIALSTSIGESGSGSNSEYEGAVKAK